MHLKNSYQKLTRAKIKRLNFDFEVLVCVRMCFFLGMRRTLIEHFSWEESAEQGVRGGGCRSVHPLTSLITKTCGFPI